MKSAIAILLVWAAAGAAQRPVATPAPAALRDGRIPFASWSARLRLVLSGRGELLSCERSGEGPVPPGNERDCETMASAPPESLLPLRGGAGERPALAVIDVSLVVDGVARSVGPALSPRARILSRAAAELQIDEQGAIESCRFEDYQGLVPNGEGCRPPTFGPFELAVDSQGRPRRRTALLVVVHSVDEVP